MKRALLLAFGLALLAGPGWAQGFIRYHPPHLTCSTASCISTVPFLAPDGSAAAPAYSFSGLTTMGMYRSGNLLAFSIGGAAQWVISANELYPGTNDTDNIGTGGNNQVAYLFLSRAIEGSKSKSLTDGAAATPVIRVPVATSGYQAGEVIWNAQSTDATDFRTTAGRIRFAGVNKAGTLTCTVNVVGTDLTASSNVNTLVCTWTNVVNTTNCDLSVTCTDNTAGSQTMTINVRADMPTTAALTFP